VDSSLHLKSGWYLTLQEPLQGFMLTELNLILVYLGRLIDFRELMVCIGWAMRGYAGASLDE